MKYLLLFLVVFAHCLYGEDLLTDTYNITVVIDGHKSNEGQIGIGLYNSEETWCKPGLFYKGLNIEIVGERIVYTIPNIPGGVYAISIYHDKNSNNKLDKIIFGIPTESYGFSNNVFGTIGPPDFSKVSFILTKNININMTMKY